MQYFKIDTLDRWEKIDLGAIHVFAAPRGGRRINLTFNTDGIVEVLASYTEDFAKPLLLASSTGLFNVEFGATKRVYLKVVADGVPDVFITGTARHQVLPPSVEESFTNPEPMGRRNSDLDRLMMAVKHNERQRDAQYKAEMDRLRAELTPKPEEKPAEPKPKPKAKGEAKPKAEDVADETADEAEETEGAE